MVGWIFIVLFFVWYVLMIVQTFLGCYGTAYRATKKGGDNGISLFGWQIVYSIVAIVPGLGIYLWLESKKDDVKKEVEATPDTEVKED